MVKRKESHLLYEEESYKIRGACFQVFNALGGCIKEKIINKKIYQYSKVISINQ